MSGPMNLVYPTQGDTADTWGTVLNALLTLVENHNHTSGKGVLIPSAGLGIDADVSWTTHALTAAKAVAFTAVATSTMTSYSNALFTNSADNNLYFRNSGGTNVQVTNGNILNVSIVGGIGGDYSAVSALLDFTDASHAYGLHQQVGNAVRQYGKLNSADVSLFEFKANPTAGVPSQSVTLKSPAALAAGYNVTWLAALPASTSLMTIDNTGQIAATTTPTLVDYHTTTAQGTTSNAWEAYDSNAAGHTKPTLGNQYWVLINSADPIIFPIKLRDGDTITQMSFYFQKNTAAATIIHFELHSYPKASGSGESAALITSTNNSNAGGYLIASVAGSVVVSSANEYYVKVYLSGTLTGGDKIYAPTPFHTR